MVRIDCCAEPSLAARREARRFGDSDSGDDADNRDDDQKLD
jgi:hypothetical protein